jgi:PAS domain S-box-containing protein
LNLRLFHRIVSQVLVFPVVALVLIAATLTWQVRTSSHTVDRIQDSNDTIAQDDLVGNLIIDQETGVRGYAATGDLRFLGPSTKAVAELPGAFATLQSHALDPQEKQKVVQLQNDYELWLESFARPVVAMTQGRSGDTNNADARDVDLNLTGKKLMDQVRSDIEALTNASEQHRARRADRWQLQTRRLVGGLAIACLLVGVFIGLFSRSRLRIVSKAYQTSLDSLRNKTEEVFLSEQRLRTTLASIGDGVITCNAQGHVLMMNQVACDLTGWTAEEALDLPLNSVFRILGEGSAPVEDPFAKVIRLNKIVGLANHAVLVRKDGQELDIDDSGAPIRDQTGAITGIVLVFRDVTMEKRTQQALISSEKLAVAGRLAASIAHEIHNPLDAVSNILYLMKAHNTVEENAAFLAMAQQELSRVMQISRSMLGLYRESVAPVPIDIKEMLVGTIVLLDHRVHDLELTVDLAVPAHLSIEGFPAELRQVFTNLVVNAIEAAGKHGAITIAAQHLNSGNNTIGEHHEDGVLIEIADNGAGIESSALPNLFEPFFSTKGEHGTGLGLWVSRGIIRKHGGIIELNNRAATPGAIARVFLATHPVISPGAN